MVSNYSLFDITRPKSPGRKILLTFGLIFMYRIGNLIPLAGIDQEALKKAFFQSDNKNAIMQIINMYSGAGEATAVVTPFALGIIPYINAQIFIDLLTTIVPELEKLKEEEGQAGQRTLIFYKKILACIFTVVQITFLIGYLKPYMYNTSNSFIFVTGIILVSGVLSVIWMSEKIDKKGIGNGTSIFILLNILGRLSFGSISNTFPLEILFLGIISIVIVIIQRAKIFMPVVSARQLSFSGKVESNSFRNIKDPESVKDQTLSAKINQAGIFPVIIASNLIPFLTFFIKNGAVQQFLTSLLYPLLIVLFNYFYTIIFWDPQKMAERLRKQSNAVKHILPGKQTENYLARRIRFASYIGGSALAGLLVIYGSVKNLTGNAFLMQVNITSFIIVVGITYDIQKNLQAIIETDVKIQTDYRQ